MRKLLLPLIALAMLGFAILHVVRAQQEPPRPGPPVNPARSPYRDTVAGAGIVEPQTENIAIGPHLPGVVEEVFVRVGDKVKPGDRLFRLDDRQLEAELAWRAANLESARAQLTRLEQAPRPEELPPAVAKVKEAQANLTDQEDQYRRLVRLSGSGAIQDEELSRKRQAVEAARQQLAKAQADLDLLKAGTWKADLAVSAAAVKQFEAQVKQTRTELDRLHVCAPTVTVTWHGVEPPRQFEVLQVNVRPGEYVGATAGQAAVVLGNVEKFHVRVDIDENDLSRFRPGAKGAARLRGDPSKEFPLTFVRVEPYVIPKRSLTGAGSERVDTRVLQVIYRIEPGDSRLYVGQQLDAFVEAAR